MKVAQSEEFASRARALGFTDEQIAALPDRIRQYGSRIGTTKSGGWSDAEQFLIGRGGIITPTEKGRILHELGHVLDDIRSPGLFTRSTKPGFGFLDYLSTERVAYGMQYGPGLSPGVVLAPYSASYAVYPVATPVVAVGAGAAGGTVAGKYLAEWLYE